MSLKDNPFTSKTFEKSWFNHFYKGATRHTFSFIHGLSFYKHPKLRLFINTGRNLTKGISYEITETNLTDFKNKVFLLYDVPDFFNVETTTRPSDLGLHRIRQYPGFLINLEPYKDLDDYMRSTFSKSSRYKFKKYHKRLESCFDISYKMFYGEVTKEEYDVVFAQFKHLLEKRFLDKQIRNNNLDAKEWGFYEDVAYPMLLDKKASLFVIYNADQPIGITLNYFSEHILFDAITVFDIDYAKFHVGSVAIMKQIEWCSAHQIKILDFSKGFFNYKERWGNKSYNFEYHIYYDKKSLFSTSTAFVLKIYFQLKQVLRNKNVNEKLHKLTFWLKNKDKINYEELDYVFNEIDGNISMDNLTSIGTDSDEYRFLEKMTYDFLYLNMEQLKDLKIYRLPDGENRYILEGKRKKMVLQINAQHI